ncbi:hypothetical protein MJI46_34820, partial [Salmonella enterica subsp. enterica serovar Cerro]|nr:hypothetical protein [Salmonella enterica subsp. enterica serovar Cerro]
MSGVAKPVTTGIENNFRGYISMVQKRQHIIEDLSVLSEMNIVLSNQRFEEAERDAKNLMY